jgi:hypothetical protein
MIYIDYDSFIPNDEWRFEAWNLTNELKNKLTLVDQLAFIDLNRSFWGLIKKEMPNSHKCWYSEAEESVSPYEVEHFRPTKASTRTSSVRKKLKTFVEQQRSDWTAGTRYRGIGYWWLAFSYKNYRLCGKLINGTKSTRFPIKENSVVAHVPTDDCDLEELILLDPTKKGDPELLTFDVDGKARPVITDPTSFEHTRAFVSIEVYGLNQIEALVKHRRQKWKDCIKAIRRAKEKYSQIEQADLADVDHFYQLYNEFSDFIENDIKAYLDPSSEFSAVAKACVTSYSHLDWMKEFVLK